MKDEGEENKTEKASWQKEGQMACGSKDIPRNRGPEAPNQKQESEKEKEVREEAEWETRK